MMDDEINFWSGLRYIAFKFNQYMLYGYDIKRDSEYSSARTNHQFDLVH